MKFQVIVERRVVYTSPIEVEAPNFEVAKRRALEFANASGQRAALVAWREESSKTEVRNMVQK